jgi:hypothetical protein
MAKTGRIPLADPIGAKDCSALYGGRKAALWSGLPLIAWAVLQILSVNVQREG